LKKILAILEDFDTITLQEMDSVALMNRRDSKFIFNRKLLPEILHKLQHYYRLLDIDGKKISRYENIYFDTEEMLFYTKHHNGRRNRLKIRMRKYLDSNITFFEIKHKNNKSRTIKKRAKIDDLNKFIEKTGRKLIEQYTPHNPDEVKPVLSVTFSRLTFVAKDMSERATLDINLSTNNFSVSKSFDNLVIAELKQDHLNHKSPFYQLMRKNRIPEYRFSKYCMGMIHAYPDLKANRFKSKVMRLNKILYGKSIA